MKLVRGKGSPTTGACWMSAIQHYTTAGEGPWHDHPECVDPVIRRLCIRLNDGLASDEERERVIGPHTWAPTGTNEGLEMTLRRARWCALQVADLWGCPLMLREWLETGRGNVDAIGLVATNAANAANAVDYATNAAHATNAAAYAANAANAADNAANAVDYAAYAVANAADYAAYAADYADLLPWILELCSWSSVPELDPVQVQRTIKEACHA